MDYKTQSIVNSVKKYYPIEVEYISEYWEKGRFFKKSKENEFLAINYIQNSEEFIIYLFKSDNFGNVSKFENDFDLGNITFLIDSLQTLEIILNSNSLESSSDDYDDIDKLFPLDEN